MVIPKIGLLDPFKNIVVNEINSLQRRDLNTKQSNAYSDRKANQSTK